MDRNARSGNPINWRNHKNFSGQQNRMVTPYKQTPIITAVAKTAKSDFKKAVKKIIAGKAETKYIQDASSLSNTAFNSAPNSNADAFFLLNQIAAGDGPNQREGDVISNVRMNVRGYVTITIPQSNLGTVRLYAVRLMLIRQKTLPLNTTNISWTSLLRGNNANNGFTGAGVNLFQPINRIDFEVFGDKVIHLSCSYYNDGTPDTARYGSDMVKPVHHKFSLTAKHKGKVQFETGTSVPTWDPFFCVGYIYEDGSGTIDTVTTNVTICGLLDAYFKDV